MADAQKNVSIRLSVTGDGQVAAALVGLEAKGRAAFTTIATSARAALPVLQSFVPLLGVASVAGLAAFAKSSLDSAAALKDQAENLGVSTERLQVYRRAADEAGSSAGDMDNALRTLQTNLGQAARGATAEAAAFRALGIDVRDASGRVRSLTAVTDDLADRLRAIEDPSERAAAAAALLGDRLGPKLAAALGQGAGGLDLLQQKMRDTGQLVEDETARSAEAFDKMASRIEQRLKALAANKLVESAQGWLAMLQGVGLASEDVLSDELLEAKISRARARYLAAQSDLERLRAQQADAQPMHVATADRRLMEAEGELDRLEAIRERRRALARDSGGGTPSVSGPVDGGSTDDLIKSYQQISAQLDPLTDKQRQFNEQMNVLVTIAAEFGDRFPEVFGLIGKLEDQMSGVAERRAAQLKRDEDLQQRGLEALKRYQKALEQEGATIREQVMLPLERYESTIERLNFLLQQGEINHETYGRAVAKAGQDLDAASRSQNELLQAVEGFGRRSSQAMADWAVGIDQANFSLGRLVQTAASEVLERILYKSLFNPFIDMASSMISSMLPSLFHEGGIVGAGAPTRAVPAHAFAGARRYHRGGLAPNEIPAILERGEEVLTRRDPRHAMNGGGTLTVIVQNVDQRSQSAPPVQTETSRGPNQELIIRNIIRSEFSQMINRGASDRDMARNYGISRAPVHRG